MTAEPSAPRYQVDLVKNLLIPMPDGVEIAADLYLPRPAPDLPPGPFPAVFESYPYRKDDASANMARRHRFFASCGYASLQLDVRGSGASGGVAVDEYTLQEQLDTVHAIDWMSRQPWCTGKVGMFGTSYGGFNSIQVAMHRPPALAAIFPMNFTDNRYTDDCHYKGGSLQMLYDTGGYGGTMTVWNALPPIPQIVGARWAELWEQRRLNEPWLLRWLAHQTYDEQWKNGSLCEDYSSIRCAVYLLGGWRDGYMNSVLRSLEHLRCPRKAIVGPWTHSLADECRPGPRIDLWGLMLRFWDHWLKGVDTGLMDEPPVTVFLQRYDPPGATRDLTSGSWRHEADWPLARSRDHALYLAPAGALASEPPPAPAAASYEYDATVGHTFPLFSNGPLIPVDQRFEEGLSPAWTTAPLAEELEVLGYGRVELRVAVTTDVATVVARLIDVAPDGRAALVTKGILNLTHRDSHEDPMPLEPGREYDVVVPLDATGYIFGRGHRVRLALAGADFPNLWPSPSPYRATIALGGTAPSRLILPAPGPQEPPLAAPAFDPPRAIPATVATELSEPGTWRVTHDHLAETTEVSMTGNSRTRVSREIAITRGREVTTIASRRDPARASARATHWTTLHWPDRTVDARERLQIESTADAFHATVQLTITMDGAIHSSRQWTRTIPRRLL